MKRHILLPGLALALYFVFMTGCDFIGMGPSEQTGPVGALRYQNYSHFQEERLVDVGDTTLTTSVTSRVNLLAREDTIATAVGIGKSTGHLDVPAGISLRFQVRSYDDDELLTEGEASFEEDTRYVLYSFGYTPNIKPVLMKPEIQESGEEEVPPLSGETSFRFLHGASTTESIDIYINRPAEADSLEPEIEELEPAFNGVSYLGFTELVTYEVSQDPNADISNVLRVRITRSDETTPVLDQRLEFNPETTQHIVIWDRDTSGDDDVLDIALGRKNGDATVIDI